MPIHSQDKAILIARGRRLKRLRTLAGLTHDNLAAKAKVSRASMSYWENATFNGLSLKAAEKLIPVIKAEGIHCSAEWLCWGLGPNPSPISASAQHPISTSDGNVQLSEIQQEEIALFISLHPHAVVMQMPHNGMAPFFAHGDYLGGILKSIKKIKKVDPTCNYIVRFDQTWQVRRINRNSAGLYDLTYLSSVESTNDLFEKRNMQIESIAKIIRVWSEP
jgi:transcriptional regulator with XRE-family HTH domain